MFCKNCGAKIEENSNFCNVCGYEVSLGKDTQRDGKILLTVGPKTKWWSFISIAGLLFLFCGSGLLFHAMSINITAFSSSRIVAEKNQNIMMALIMIVVAITFIYEGMKWASMKITVCENVVYGSFGIGESRQFRLTYDKITDISGGSNSTNTIVIVTKAKSYVLVHMEHAKEVAQIINNKINLQ